MVKGIGIDIVEIQRMHQIIARWGETFLNKIFTDQEISYAKSKIYSVQHYAARFAVKEAFAKAIATGWSGSFRWKDIEVSNVESGEPTIILHGKSKTIFEKHRYFVSISHSESVAMAVVVVEDI